MKIDKILIVAVLAGWTGCSLAAVSAEQAKQLGTTLTEFGAIKSGNEDGSIPAYTGGVETIPADFEPGSGHYPDPYQDEKPKLKITASNMDQYADKLSAGAKELLKRFPDFYLSVYPTHRSMGYPEWQLKNAVKNATTAKLVGKVEGDGVTGAYGGIPFPIPQNGNEVMWNFLLNNSFGTRTREVLNEYLVDGNGTKTHIVGLDATYTSPYYDPDQTELKGPWYRVLLTYLQVPASQAGQIVLIKNAINNAKQEDTTWIYNPGQRRVRLAPEYKYDTPSPQTGGATLFDEINGYSGRQDRFDFKLVGRKEMYIPYNNYQSLYGSKEYARDVIAQPNFPNPDKVRWELHRVWEVEATLKDGARHVYKRRTFYFDEDSWQLVLSDNYDHADNLYRIGYVQTAPFYDKDKPRLGSPGLTFFDLNKGAYYTYVYSLVIPYNDVGNMSDYSPDAMAAAGVR